MRSWPASAGLRALRLLGWKQRALRAGGGGRPRKPPDGAGGEHTAAGPALSGRGRGLPRHPPRAWAYAGGTGAPPRPQPLGAGQPPAAFEAAGKCARRAAGVSGAGRAPRPRASQAAGRRPAARRRPPRRPRKNERARAGSARRAPRPPAPAAAAASSACSAMGACSSTPCSTPCASSTPSACPPPRRCAAFPAASRSP